MDVPETVLLDLVVFLFQHANFSDVEAGECGNSRADNLLEHPLPGEQRGLRRWDYFSPSNELEMVDADCPVSTATCVSWGGAVTQERSAMAVPRNNIIIKWSFKLTKGFCNVVLVMDRLLDAW
jgi:hypothetical protein